MWRPARRRNAAPPCERLAGRLKAAVDFGQIDELIGGIDRRVPGRDHAAMRRIHEAVYAAYIAYGAETVALDVLFHPPCDALPLFASRCTKA